MVGTLLGQFLCQLVERPMPQVRLLGKSELVTIPNNHSVVANGNNVAIAADMVRRTLQISLDADDENPESRTFTRNPVAEVLADRGTLYRRHPHHRTRLPRRRLAREAAAAPQLRRMVR